jgi:hypothetical protein
MKCLLFFDFLIMILLDVLMLDDIAGLVTRSSV